jgi:hypothetical protein
VIPSFIKRSWASYADRLVGQARELQSIGLLPRQHARYMAQDPVYQAGGARWSVYQTELLRSKGRGRA